MAFSSWVADCSLNLPSLLLTVYQFLHLLGLVLEVEKGVLARVQAVVAAVVAVAAAWAAGPAGLSVS